MGCELAEAFGSLVLLLLFLGVGVYVHEGQAHIRLWHEEREGCIEADAGLSQVFFQYLDGLADVVACRAEGVCMVPLGLQTKSGDEFSDQHGGRQPCTGKQKPIRSPKANSGAKSPVAWSGMKTNCSWVSLLSCWAAQRVLPVPEK